MGPFRDPGRPIPHGRASQAGRSANARHRFSLEALGTFPSVGAVVAGAPRSRTFRPLLDPSSHRRATCRLASGSTISPSTSTEKGGVLNVVAPHPTALESTSRHLSIDTSRADRLGTLEDLRSGIATGRESRPGRRGTEPALQPSAAFRPLPWPHTACPPFRQTFGWPVGCIATRKSANKVGEAPLKRTVAWQGECLTKNSRTAGVRSSVWIRGRAYSLELSGTLSKWAWQLVACACVFSAVLDDEVPIDLRPHHVWGHVSLTPLGGVPVSCGDDPCLVPVWTWIEMGGSPLHRTHRSRPKSRICRVIEPWEPHR